MNKKLLLLLSLSVLTGGCEQAGMMPERTCEPYQRPPVDCKDVGHPAVVKLNTNTLKANPPNVCVDIGGTIRLEIVPPRGADEKGTVSVYPKEITDTWLTGTNSPDENKIEIVVPNWVDSNTDHDYGFATSDGKCVDPRVHVN